ncbi:MAG: hypothetical protein KQH79_04210 [Bacteroidetes bacterium]|nr:hypothetical protein [Bacteroidota bacterium]
MKRKTVVFLLLLFLLGCGPYIWFKVPQPQGRENLTAFPVELQGKYSSVVDTVIIHIEKERIIREYRENLLMTKGEFREETGDSIAEDTTFTFSGNWQITVKSFGDSVQIFSKKDDELFHISERQILREYKGYYFLNYKDTNNFWKVKILDLQQDSLEFDFILSDDDMRQIRNITKVEVKKDSTSESSKYYLNPMRRELRKILRKRKPGEKYVKL